MTEQPKSIVRVDPLESGAYRVTTVEELRPRELMAALVGRYAGRPVVFGAAPVSPPAEEPPGMIKAAPDALGRVPIEPYLTEIAQRGGTGWLSPDQIARECLRLGWSTRGQQPANTAAKALKRLIDDETPWLERGGVSGREYRLLPLKKDDT